MTTISTLNGQALLDYVHANNTLTRVQLCEGAGYERKFTAFYEAILDARKANGEYDRIALDGNYYDVNGMDWYEEMLTDDERALYDMIEDMCPEFTKLDASECQQFMDELEEIGITNADTFECAYMYQTDAFNAESDYAQYVHEEIMCHDVPGMLVVDWQATYNYALKYDTNVIEFDGTTYFFQNI